jgi:hypothetical protein
MELHSVPKNKPELTSAQALSTLYNCTVTGNSAVWGGGTWECTLYNCIVCFNTNSIPSSTPDCAGGTLNNCWVTLDPLFVAYTQGNLRLQSYSPCINAGNSDFGTADWDLDGRPRIVGSAVDIGAYEYQPGVSGAFIGWLEQYRLPTDGYADYFDSDRDGLNNWQEWRCGTNPTNSLSALRLLSATPQGTNITVTWQSVARVNYFLKRSADLASPFQFVATNIVGQAGATTFTDTNAAGAGPFFYRVGVGN